MAVVTENFCEVSSSVPFVVGSAPSYQILSGSIVVRHEAVEATVYCEDLKVTILMFGLTVPSVED